MLGALITNTFVGVLPVFADETETVAPNAVDTRQAALDFVRSSEAYEFGDKDAENGLTETEWQLLGTYMSNYFVPYETYLTSKATTSDSKTIKMDKDTLKVYKDVLVNTLGMQEDNADYTAQKILSNMVDPKSYKDENAKGNTTQRL